jgi:hypothetical protein
VFSFSRKELEKHMEMWLQVLRQFYENAWRTYKKQARI